MRLKKKYRIALILIIITCVLLFIFRTKNYQIEYDVDNYHINELFNKDTKVYEIVISKDDFKFTFLKRHRYIRGRKIILSIDQIKDADTTCLEIDSKKIDVETICYQGNDKTSPYLMSDNIKSSLDLDTDNEDLNIEYKNIKINDYMNHDYYVWNYQGFIHIGPDDKETIKLFNNDIYDASIIGHVNNYIVIADYNSDYFFNQFYIYDMEKKKVKKLDFKYDINLSSTILGTNKKSLYLLDTKAKKEYEIVPHRMKIRVLKNPVVYDEGLKTTTINKLINNEVSWKEDKLVNYVVKDNLLYKYYLKDEMIKISNQYVTKIIETNDQEVFYLVGNTLYVYNDLFGEKKLFSYYEWTFNNNSPVIIY